MIRSRSILLKSHPADCTVKVAGEISAIVATGVLRLARAQPATLPTIIMRAREVIGGNMTVYNGATIVLQDVGGYPNWHQTGFTERNPSPV